MEKPTKSVATRLAREVQVALTEEATLHNAFCIARDRRAEAEKVFRATVVAPIVKAVIGGGSLSEFRIIAAALLLEDPEEQEVKEDV